MNESPWRQPIRFFVVGLIFLIGLWLLVILQPLISSLMVAALLAYMLHPLVNWILRHTRFSHTTAVNIVYLLFLLALIAIPAILTPIIIGQVRGLTPDFEQIGLRIRAITEHSFLVGNIPVSLGDVFGNLEAAINQTVAGLASNLGGVLAGISTNFLWILIVLVSIYYLLKDSHTLIDWSIGLVSPPYRHHARQLVAEIDAIWGNFLRGQLLLMTIVGVLSWLGAAIVGMPGAVFIGFIAGVLDIIPSLGPTLAAIIAAAVALFEGSTYLPVSKVLFALIILAIFILIQQIENIWIRPALMSRRLRLHPAFVLIGVFGSLALFGIFVTLVIIPLMATLGALGRYARLMLQGVDPYPLPPPQDETE